MLIDSFTVFAQIINFLILVALLKHFLYQPIVKAMEERELKIINTVREASLQLENAENQALIYKKKQEELEQKKQAWLLQAKQEVMEEKKILLQQAQQEVEVFKTQWYEQLDGEKRSYLDNLQQQISQQVISTVRHVLEDLAGTELESEIVNMFRQRLQTSNLPLLANSDEPLIVKTSFDLTPEQQRKLINTIHKYLIPDVSVKFVNIPELICGIELTNQSYQLAWNLQEYLLGLEQALSI